MSKEYCVTMMVEDCEVVEANSLEEAIERAIDSFLWTYPCVDNPEVVSVDVKEGEKFKPVYRVGDVVVVDEYIMTWTTRLKVGTVTNVDGNVVEVDIFGENAPHLKFVDGWCEFNMERWNIVGHATYDSLIEYIKGCE